MSNFTTWRSLVDGEEIDRIPDSEGTHQWNADEGSGSTLTDSIGSLDGTINNATWQTNSTGAGDAYLLYDGVDDYVDLESTTAFASLRDNVEGTIFAWHRLDSADTGTYQTLLASNTSTSDTDFSFNLNDGDNQYEAWLTLNDDHERVTGGSPNDNVGDWVAYAWVVDGSGMELFTATPGEYDVSLVGTSSKPSSTSNNWDNNMTVGSRNASGRQSFDGAIDLSFFDSDPWSESELQDFIDDSKQFYE